MWRVIGTDNHGMSGESPGHDERDVLLVQLPNQQRALAIADILNEDVDDHSSEYYIVVYEGYDLRRFEP